MVPSGQMYFSGYYAPVKSIIQTKYIANQMGKCKENTTTVTPLSALNLIEELTQQPTEIVFQSNAMFGFSCSIGVCFVIS